MPAFTHVQKRFVRLPGEQTAIAGYNHQAWSAFSGPGYFVATKGDGELEGEILIDYTKLPNAKPGSWPAIRPNEGFIPGIVYGGMTDRLRAVSAHVSIGRAYKARAMDVWFALVRKDVP